MEYTTGKGWNPKIGGVSISKEVFSGSMLFFGGVSARILLRDAGSSSKNGFMEPE